ncbi:extracellular solute-binding protein [Kineococcus rhizosphaerae]|uniref:Carbohydrate ABC transporter substrate-binding protein (CUT1 family) n=1 Tax=Kineococcus rhizosphaerae TaxID=559628 RepID=A0A2T0R4A1_9ACTN|nr:extracellular solute-binding protein [Kineococcus rhizosphaerae]PRY15198.1 carbohydrate ABC transporter substrate-binding protein (CUT1 family) [Kineococcus rhizosphaerae]
MAGRWRTRLGILSAATVLAGGLTACGGSSTASGTPTLNWYVNPDNGGQAKIAADCSEQSGGAYTIDTSILPRDAAAQREQLMRRLAGNDSSIDLMSLDPVFVPETSEAGFLAKVPADLQQQWSDGVVDGAVQGASWKGELVTAPFWANTQLLWYRKSVAQAAGLDVTKPLTWDQLVQAAKAQGTAIGVQGQRAESMTVWVNAMIASAGGEVIENPDAKGPDIRLGLESDAGKAAAKVMQDITAAGVGGPGIDNRDEAATANLFQQGGAAFMVNWPFVYAQGKSAAEEGTMDQAVFDDYGWTTYPAMSEGQEAKPPLGGIDIGVSAFSEHQDAAFQAVSCIVSEQNQAAYMVSDGNPAALESVYDDPQVQEAYPMYDTIRTSLQAAAPRPQTAYYNEVSQGIADQWQPVSGVTDRTPGASQEYIGEVLRGEKLL